MQPRVFEGMTPDAWEASLNLGDILNRVRDRSAARNDAELAKLLHVSPTNVSRWRERGTIPWRSIALFSIDTGINSFWLLTGRTLPPANLFAQVAEAMQ